jgi:hypothetical protein
MSHTERYSTRIWVLLPNPEMSATTRGDAARSGTWTATAMQSNPVSVVFMNSLDRVEI